MEHSYPLYRKWFDSPCIVRFDSSTGCTVVVADTVDPVGTQLDLMPSHDDTRYWELLNPLQLAALQLKENHAIQDITSSDI